MSQSSHDGVSVFVKTKSQSKNESFTNTLRPFYIISRMFGLLPFSIKFDANGEIQDARVSAFDLLWFAISICVYLFMAVAFNLQMMEIPPDYKVSFILYFGDMLLSLSGLIFGPIEIIMDMCNRFKLVSIIRKLTAFDKEVICQIC